jgi:twitching motility protein PilJ
VTRSTRKWPFLLGKDTNAFRDTLQGLNKGSGDADTREKLAELDNAFKSYQAAIGGILGNMQPLVLSKQAGARIFRGSEELLKATDDLATGYQQELSEQAVLHRVADCPHRPGCSRRPLALLAKIYLD